MNGMEHYGTIPDSHGQPGTSRNVLTTLNCSALVPVIMPKAGAGSRGGRGR
jgi:hypothetical protein